MHSPLSGPDLTYISLLIIFCIIEYLMNKNNLEGETRQCVSKCYYNYNYTERGTSGLYAIPATSHQISGLVDSQAYIQIIY